MNKQAIRSRLETRHAQLVERLGRVTKDIRHSSGLEADFAEQVSQRENDEVLAGLDDSIREEIFQIRDALSRIDVAGYGICGVCHQPISGNRLKALPYATRCFGCECATGVSHKEE
jgi:RNA polymerase-binding transcription factor DksA